MASPVGEGPTHERGPAGGPGTKRNPFQILALDGGGIRGLFSASVLAALEEDLQTRIVSHFDLVVGASTGGIVALGLGAGLPPKEIVDLHVRLGRSVFSGTPWRGVVRTVRSKYSATPLQAALEQALGARQMWESIVPLVINAYDLTNDGVHLFKTPHHERLRRDWRLRMADVAMATSAAPTYLPAYKLDGCRFVDGGLWANNPVLIGIAEAVSLFDRELDDIRVLSLSTTSALRHRHRRLDVGGMVQWATTAIDVVLNGQSRGANGLAFHMIGDRLLRIDEKIPPGVLGLDRLDLDQLKGRASSVSRLHAPDVKRQFLDHVAAPFHPHHRPREGQNA